MKGPAKEGGRVGRTVRVAAAIGAVLAGLPVARLSRQGSRPRPVEVIEGEMT